MDRVGRDEADYESAETDENALPQLFEVLDQRRLLAVLQAARETLHGRALDGFVLARRSGRRLDRGGGRKLGSVIVFRDTGDRVLELLHSRAERATDLRQPLRAEEQQREEEQEDDLAGSNVSHAPRLPTFGPIGYGPILGVWILR